MNKFNIKLGCGLIGIGRSWGPTRSSNIPSEKDAIDFLEYAFGKGIRFFDTAPAYGYSEERLGKFLRELTTRERNETIIATKCGHFHDLESNVGRSDHSPESIKSSVKQSLKLLGKIDILQIHKANVKVVQDKEVLEALKSFKNKIKYFGISVSNSDPVEPALKTKFYDFIQHPYFEGKNSVQDIFPAARKMGINLIINRPLNMGHLIHNLKKDKMKVLTEAYSFILKENFKGYILSGTSSKKHLSENINAFNNAKNLLKGKPYIG